MGTIHKNLKDSGPVSSIDPLNATFILLQTGRIAQAENFELLLIYPVIISLNVLDSTFAHVVTRWFLTAEARVRS